MGSGTGFTILTIAPTGTPFPFADNRLLLTHLSLIIIHKNIGELLQTNVVSVTIV